jgi:AmmeMemoRadiSam system protein A
MDFIITGEEKRALLADAREVITASLEEREPDYRRTAELTALIETGLSALAKPLGAFVTLHKTMGRSLRGCIGRMSASSPLEKTVRAMACEAAFGDPRFPPLKKNELSLCDIEISVLSPMEPCPDPQSVKIGVHGLYLICRGRAGVLLPQVPVEQGWNLDEYLEYICVKAGLPHKSYETPGAELFTFTAAVFGEHGLPAE